MNGADSATAATAIDSRDSGKRLLPWLVALAFFMESLDTTVVNTAVPVIAQALGVVPLSMKSVLSSYTLSLAVFIPISGWVADRFGTRAVFSSAIHAAKAAHPLPRMTFIRLRTFRAAVPQPPDALWRYWQDVPV